MNYYDEIKNTLVDLEVYKKVKNYSKNRYELEKYYEVGKLLIDAQGGEERAKYGDGLIKEYSIRLMVEIGKKYSYRNLMSMRKFYIIFKNEKVNALRSQLTWTHYRELLKLDNYNEIRYYILLSIGQNLSYRQLHSKIEANEYERLDDSTKRKLILNKKLTVGDNLRHPIVIKNKYNTSLISEKMLQLLVLENIADFMKELGVGFSFVDSEYKIRLGDRFNFIDLLLFNVKYNCYVVIELKVTGLKKEHIGQILMYMNYVDRNVKEIYHNETIGIIIAKRDNKFVMEYCSDERIFSTTYQLI